MTLSCSHPDCDDPTLWYYSHPRDFLPLPTVRARRCCSCGQKIQPGDLSVAFPRFHLPRNHVEERIYGTDDAQVPMANWYMCEECGGLFYSLAELGYSIWLGEDMYDVVREYAEMKDEERARAAEKRKTTEMLEPLDEL